MIHAFTEILNRLLSTQRVIGSSNHRIALAVSGGSDSMALILLAQAAGYPVTALTVDHRLRPESRKEAEQVAKWMAAHGIAHQILTWEHTEIKGNLQALARKARYELLTAYCRSQGIGAVLLGHTQDDQAETIAMRQAREAGPVGLAGMSAISEVKGVLLLRPLLAFRRQELREYLRQRGQQWIDDPSNENTDFSRIRIRQELSQDAPRYRALLALGQEMTLRRQQIEQAYAEFIAQSVETFPTELVVAREGWKRLVPEIALYALCKMLPAVSGRHYPPRYRELQSLYQKMSAAKGKATLGKCTIQWNEKEIVISAEGLEMRPVDSHMKGSRACNLLAKPLVSLPFYCIQNLHHEGKINSE